MKFADLHIHSTASDGKLRPGQIVDLAKGKGFYCIAIADHDSVNGVDEALVEGKEQGIEVIPCIELSTIYQGREVHILGYYIDWRSEALIAKLNQIMKVRNARARLMVEKLFKMGMDITWGEVETKAGSGYVGRPHIARVMLVKGYIQDIREAFTEKYIGNNGKAYVERYEMPPEEAIELVRHTGGIAVLAHPGFLKKDAKLGQADIEYFISQGLKGIEVYHTKHDEEDEYHYKNIAESLDLAITGGSDCHGGNTGEILMGKIKLPYLYVEKLKEMRFDSVCYS